MRKALAVLLLVGLLALPNVVGCSSGPEFSNGITGTVFEDANANGIQDDGEAGVKGVLVSNGEYCRATNKAGEYSLPAEGSLVYITTPSAYTPTGQWYASISWRPDRLWPQAHAGEGLLGLHLRSNDRHTPGPGRSG